MNTEKKRKSLQIRNNEILKKKIEKTVYQSVNIYAPEKVNVVPFSKNKDSS